MDFFISKVELKREVGKHEIYMLIKQWLTGSPNYKIDLNYDEISEYYEVSGKETKVSIISKVINDDTILACRFEFLDENNIWITDCIYVRNDKFNSFSVKVSCKNNLLSGSPKTHKPYIIKLLMESGYCLEEGYFPINDKPIYLKKRQLDLCADILNGKINVNLPIVYVSALNGESKKRYALELKKLAIKLSGMAHVLVEPCDITFSLKLSDMTEKRNPFGGYIGVFFNNTTYKETIPFTDKNGQTYDENTIINKISDILIQTALNYVNPTDHTWSNLQLYISRIKCAEALSKAEEKSVELEEWRSNFDEENVALKNDIDRLQAQLKNKDQKIGELQNKITNLQYTLEGLKNRYYSNSSVSFEKGDFAEIVPDEIKDTILNVLKHSLPKLSKDSRAYDRLENILALNDISGNMDRWLDDAKSALLEKSTPVKLKKLEVLGISNEEGKHIKLKLSGNKGTVVLSKSPSDWRDPENTISVIRRKLDTDIKVN